MQPKKVAVVIEMSVTDQEVADYIVETVAANPQTWLRGEPFPLSDALAGFLIEAIGPEYPDDPDAEAERFFDRYHSGDWICPTAIRIEGK